MKKILVAAIAAAALLAACGSDDDTENALSAVCDAETEVLANVGNLVTLDPDETTGDDFSSMVDDLQSSVDQLDEARGDLAEQDVDNVQSAFEDLKSALSGLGDVPLSELDAAVVETVGTAVIDFRTAYEEAYANSSCTEEAAEE